MKEPRNCRLVDCGPDPKGASARLGVEKIWNVVCAVRRVGLQSAVSGRLRAAG
jgi:hypothetical protein